MANTHKGNITFVYNALILCCDAGTDDMLTYIDYIVYTFKASHEQVPLRGKPQVLQDYFSSYFMFCVTIFAAEHVYARWKILYMCSMSQNYTPLPLFSQCLYASHSTKYTVCTLRPKMHLQSSSGTLLYNTSLNKSNWDAFVCFS